MKIKFIHTFVFLFVFSVVYSQNFIPLQIDSDSKLASEFNDKTIKVLFNSEIKDNRISINMEVANNIINKEKYYYFLYLIDRKPYEEVNNTRNLYKWLTNNFKEIDLTYPMKDDEVDFGGTFIDYNPEYLSREVFKTGLLMFKDKSIGHEKYSLVPYNVNPNTEVKITYVFLIANFKKKEIVGLTEPVEYFIPPAIIKQLLPPETKGNQRAEKTGNEQQPDQALIKDYEGKVKDIIAPFQHKGSYRDDWKDYELYKKYADGNYNRQINDLKDEINTSLKGSIYKSKRDELIRNLDNFTDPTNTVDANIEKLRPKEVSKCEMYESSYNLIIKKLGKVSGEISDFEKKVLPKISNFEKDMAGCKEEQSCYADIKRRFEKEDWQKQLTKYNERINTQRGTYNSLKNKSDYKTCNLSTTSISNKIKETEKKLDGVEEAILSFRIKLESIEINKSVLKLAVDKFQTNIDTIIQQFEDIKKNYLNMDNEFFASGSLENSQINVLEDGFVLLGQMSGRIDGIVAKAAEFYEFNDNQSSKFSEAMFKQQTEINITDNDINQLKSNIDQLVLEAGSTDDDHIVTMIIIGLVVLLLIIGGYSYFRGLMKRKISGVKQPKSMPQANVINSSGQTHQTDVGGMEIIDDDENESLKGIGLDKVRKLSGIEYFEIDVQGFVNDTVVRKVYFSRDFIKKAYWYFEDRLTQAINIDDLYEFGGYIIGKWDQSPYNKEQYDLSLEHFIEPGEDAKFTKFNIDFGYDISFRMEEMLIDLASNGNDQVLVGWLHSHPGHNVFLSNYDLDVQEKFRNQFHPNRHIALVLEPTTTKWDMGLFTFKNSGTMNNKEEVNTLLSFHDMYNWAKGDHKPLATQRHFTLDISNDSSSEIGSISFEKSVILDVKKYIERELSAEASSQKSFYFSGVKSDAGSLKSNYYIVEMLDMKLAGQSSLGKYSGLFAALTPQNSIEEVEEFCKKELSAGGLKFAMIYQLKSESFSLIPLNRDRAFEAKKYWIKFSIQDIVPFLIK